MEPSALEGMPGIMRIMQESEYLAHNGLLDKMDHAIHIAWGTGGSMVPKVEMERYYLKGKKVLEG